MVSNPFSEGLSVQIDSDTAGFESGIAGAIDKLGNFKGAVAAAGTAAGALAAGGLAKSVDAASNFDAAMTESLAIMGDVSDGMRNKMEGAAREMAKTTTFSAEQAADSYFYLASAGLDAQESIEAMDDVATFAQAGMFDMEKATDLLTDSASALGIEMDNLSMLGDKFVKANTLANTSVEQVAQAMTNKAAPAMKRMGVETDEGIAALSVFADQGLKGRRAGTIFARTLEGLGKKAQENSKAFERLGVQVYDANGEMRPLKAIVQDMEGAFEGMSTEQKQAALEQLGFNKRAQQGIDLLLGNSQQLGEYEKQLGNAGGTAEEVANNQLQSFDAQLELLKSQLTDIGISIGQVLLPPLSRLISFVSDAVAAFAGWNEKTDGVLGAITLLGTAFAGLVSGLGMVASHLGIAGSATGALSSALTALTGPIGIAIAAVAALAAAFVTDFGGIRTQTMRVANVLKQELQPVFSWLRSDGVSIVNRIKSAVMGFAQRAEPVVRRIATTIGDALIASIRGLADATRSGITTAIQLWRRLRPTVQTAISGIRSAVETGMSVVSSVWTQHIEPLLPAARRVFNSVQSTVSTSLQTVRSVVTTVLSTVSSLWTSHLQPIIARTRQAFGQIRTTIQPALNWMRAQIQTVLSYVSGLWSQHGGKMLSEARMTWNTIKSTVQPVIQWFQTKIQAVTSAVSGIWRQNGSQMRNETRSTFTSIRSIVQPALQWFQTKIQTVTSAVTAFWNQHGDKIIAIVRTLFNTVKTISQTVFQWFQSRTNEALSLIQSYWNVFGDDIMNIARQAFETIKTIIEQAFDAISSIFTVAMRVIRGDWEGALDEIRAFGKRTFDRIISLATGWKDTLLGIVSTLVDQWIGLFEDLYQRLIGGSIIPNMIDSILGAVDSFGSNLENLLFGFIDNYVGLFQMWKDNAIKVVNSLADGVLNAIDIASEVYSSGKAVASSFADGIRNKISQVESAASDLASAARDKMPFSDAKEGPLSSLSEAGPGFVDVVASGILDNIRKLEKASVKAAMAARPDLTAGGAPIAAMAGGGKTDNRTYNIDIDVHSSDPKQAGDEVMRRLAGEGLSGLQ